MEKWIASYSQNHRYRHGAICILFQNEETYIDCGTEPSITIQKISIVEAIIILYLEPSKHKLNLKN